MADEGRNSAAGSARWVSTGGVLSCLGGAAFFLLSSASGREARSLASIPQTSKLSEVASLLSSAPAASPLLVAARGAVGSRQPIACENSDMRGVILEERVDQHFLRPVASSASWVADSTNLHQKRRSVPWFLEDSSGSVWVDGHEAATGLKLVVASQRFEQQSGGVSNGFVVGVGADGPEVQQVKITGVKHEERILPMGAELTVVGQAFKDKQGEMRLRKPPSGPFIITTQPLRSVIDSINLFSRATWWVSTALTAMGAVAMASKAIRTFLERRRRRARREVRGSEGGRRETEDQGGEVTAESCIICLDLPYNCVFQMCGHMCCCIECGSKLRICPLCRSSVGQVIRVYRH